MGLLNRFFRQDAGAPASVPPSASHYEESEPKAGDPDEASRTAVRRELVQVTLRETMRRHAVPSDWLDLRMLPAVSRRGKRGMHVQLVVKQGQGSLLSYIPAFQSSFMAEIEKFEPRAWEWLLSISWQFAAITSSSGGELPATKAGWTAAGGSAAAAPAPGSPQAGQEVDEDVAQDLQALFAIRDAVLREPPPGPPAPGFEPTRPGGTR